MTLSGIAWGLYTLRGKQSINPLSDTYYNFLRTLPFVLILVLLTLTNSYITFEGALLAMLSGEIASRIGYAIWYRALKGLDSTEASVVQLSVPLIAAIGGYLFANDQITVRLIISATLILGGILLVIFAKQFKI